MRNTILIIMLVLATSMASAQDSLKVRKHSTMFGVGLTDVYDTYLSPYSYDGGEIRVTRETYRMTKMMDGKISVQTLVDVNIGYTKNNAGTAHELVGGLSSSWNWFYPFLNMNMPKGQQLRILAGGGVNGYLGGIYNSRNGNNPAQGRLNIGTDLTCMAEYDFKLNHKTSTLRYQFMIPFVGVAFSPNYGQSYYEIFSLGNYDSNVVCTWIGNMPSISHLLTLDIPMKKSVIRVGYRGVFRQSTWNNLRYHNYSNCLMVGWVKSFGITK